MSLKKRALDDSSTFQQRKKVKHTENVAQEVDFPRGGGTSFTPLEVKSIRAEAVKEADEELFTQKPSKRKRKSDTQPKAVQKLDQVRIEHLNYKRLLVGMKILGQIVSIQPLALIVSLPNQLFGHVPITAISSQLTERLERIAEQEDEEDESQDEVPELSDLFQVGHYVRAVVTAVHASGSTDASVIGKTREQIVRASRRVELSLIPGRVNAGVQKSDLKHNFTISATVKSVEDHGYILDLGLSDTSGFLPFKDTNREKQFIVGSLLNVSVQNLSTNGRTCNVSVNNKTFSTASLSEATNASSILPGALVQCLITAVQSAGINVQLLGFFDGTIEQMHLGHDPSGKKYKIGKKIKARVLYNIMSTPPRFALAMSEHVIDLHPRQITDQDRPEALEQVYPIGKVLESTKVVRIEPDRGVILDVASGVEGFAHISHLSDDHLPTIVASGPWKVGSLHRARVTGYFPLDGLLQLSLKPSVLQEKFFQVQDVEVGEVIKGTIKKLSDTALFVSIAGNLDGVVWANHFADIALKHPAKRFKIGANIKCRVLSVDQERKRVSLTAKKSLIESTLPIISSLAEARVGLITHGTVYKVSEKSLMVEFYNGIRALVPFKEASDGSVTNLADSFSSGKVVKVCIVSVETEQKRLIASIRQALPNAKVYNPDITGVEISDTVVGTLQDFQGDNAVLSLVPSEVKALISLNNLANRRGMSPAQLRADLKIGDKLEPLVVVTRNVEKAFVIVATKPDVKATGSKVLSIDSVTLGQVVQGRVTSHTRHGVKIKLSSHIGGILHPTDTSDNYEATDPFPAVDSILRAAVVHIDRIKKQLTLSTRQSKMFPDQSNEVVDREITALDNLKPGDTVRGFIKNIADHGVFVTVGREIDARVQIRELFDDYVKEWKERFQTHQLVKGRILNVDLESKKVEMTFRSTDSQKGPNSMTLSDLQKGQKVEGLVRKIENYGLFIQIVNSKLSGLCHKSELSDNADADTDLALHNFREGDRVKAFILDIVQRKISFSLKPSHFDNEDFAMNEDHLGDFGVVDDIEEPAGESASSESEHDDEDDHMQVDLDVHPSFQPPKSNSRPLLPLQVAAGFQWSTADADIESNQSELLSDEDDGGDADKVGKKKRKRKVIEQDLTADLHTKAPESNADFERLLLGSPNSSYLWIQYMSFQLQISEVDKAREVAKKALQTIHFREEQEKLNVWVALLNLESAYGTEESLETTFKSATRANDSKTVHLRLAAILEQAEKFEKAEEQYKRTCKKFGLSSKVWILFSEFYLKRGNVEEARKLLPRSLQSLEKRKHLKTISRFAQLEYKLGEPERGKTLFEGIVDSHPKRTDLWSVYIDMEAGQGNIQSLRDLFNRLFAIKMTSRKAKALFKKWLELERRMGDEEGASMVKEKAIEWTQQAASS